MRELSTANLKVFKKPQQKKALRENARSAQTVKKVLRAAARFKQGFATCGKTHKNPRHVRGFLYKPTASVPVRARAAAGILDRKRGFDRRLFEKRSFYSLRGSRNGFLSDWTPVFYSIRRPHLGQKVKLGS